MSIDMSLVTSTIDRVDNIDDQNRSIDVTLGLFRAAEILFPCDTLIGKEVESYIPFNERLEAAQTVSNSILLNLLGSGLTLKDFNILAARPKLTASIAGKLERYEEISIQEIFDFVGIRIIVSNLEVLEKVQNLVCESYPVLQDLVIGKSIIHKGIRDVNKETGYKARHINVKGLPGYNKNLTVEIQLILQKNWKEMRQKLGDPVNPFSAYK